ncbi:uncharacterized protein Z520_08493 [Fonsecaea multimorphosa CBS 102226]|uniref:DNA2/NAM7 helicase-like C-terminal domain-containing protein n=1 Tax=Fonsecaea multimorphosa CBS 102226 TaxID=1442371 RepID=A0A0D2H1T4_9EURO|nr:uncharacterized protein Z520_08493 [Fonsecaea multimorphosa CBS 102226]KIX95785.1 hypothetical protein Z520_08493 [Fonsecaea multimorphosa CBS 102226]OAL21521.1 hypothetical protein AYO22_07917 [Fonsecaea multimorphosa]
MSDTDEDIADTSQQASGMESFDRRRFGIDTGTAFQPRTSPFNFMSAMEDQDTTFSQSLQTATHHTVVNSPALPTEHVPSPGPAPDALGQPAPGEDHAATSQIRDEDASEYDFEVATGHNNGYEQHGQEEHHQLQHLDSWPQNGQEERPESVGYSDAENSDQGGEDNGDLGEQTDGCTWNTQPEVKSEDADREGCENLFKNFQTPPGMFFTLTPVAHDEEKMPPVSLPRLEDGTVATVTPYEVVEVLIPYNPEIPGSRSVFLAQEPNTTIEQELENMFVLATFAQDKYGWRSGTDESYTSDLYVDKAFLGIPVLNVPPKPLEQTLMDLRWHAYRMTPTELESLSSHVSVSSGSDSYPGLVELPFAGIDYDLLHQAFKEYRKLRKQDYEDIEDPESDDDEEKEKKRESKAKAGQAGTDDKKEKQPPKEFDDAELLANISQSSRLLADKFNKFEGTKDPNAQIQDFDQIIHRGSLNTTYSAAFFSTKEGSPLSITPIRGYLGVNIELHSASFVPMVTDETVAEAIRQKARDIIAEPTKSNASQDPSTGPDLEKDTDGKRAKAKKNALELIKQAKAKATYVKLFIGFEAMKGWKCDTITNWEEWSHGHPKVAKTFSADMVSEIQTIIKAQGAAAFVEFHFDYRAAAQHRVSLGCPKWGDQFAKALQTGSIRAIVKGQKESVRRMAFVGELLDHEKSNGSRLLQYWWNEVNHRVVCRESYIRTTPLSDTVTNDNYRFMHRLPHMSTQEAMIKTAVTVKQARATLMNSLPKFTTEIHDVVFASIKTLKDGTDESFLAFIDYPAEEGLVLTPDTRMFMSFIDEKKTSEDEEPEMIVDNKNIWTARVIDPVPNGPADKLTLWVNRRWDETKGEWGPRVIHSVDVAGASESEFPALIKHGFRHKVTLKVQTPEIEYKRIINAIDLLLFEPKHRPWTAWNKLLKTLISCNNLDTLEPRSIFEPLGDEFEQNREAMVLSPEQQAAINLGLKARGGVLNVTGVSGSGKTHLISQILVPYLMSSSNVPILLTAGANGPVNCLASLAWKTYQRLIYQGRAKDGQIHVRLHADNTDKQVLLSHIRDQMTRNPNARPEWEELDLHDASNMDIIVRQHVDKLRKSTVKGCHDLRLEHDNLSLGAWVWRYGGFEECPSTADGAATRFEKFRTSFIQYYTTKEMGREQAKQFREEEGKIMLEVLSKAKILSCTLYAAGSMKVISSFGQECVLVVIDEAPTEGLPVLLPLAAARLPVAKSLVMVGDTKQKGPIKPGIKKTMPFVDDVFLPLPTRLQLVGFETAELFEQRRMVPQIASLANQLVYSGMVKNDYKEAGTANRPYAREFGRWLKDKFGLQQRSYVGWVDFTGKIADTVMKRTSKLNYYYALSEINWAVEILRNKPKDFKLAILTGYSAHRKILLDAKASMQLDTAGTRNIHLDRLFIGTIDHYQGDQFNVVILDLLVDENAGFFKDIGRLCVALTRARDGLLILMSRRAVAKLRPDSGSHLKTLATIMKPFHISQRAGRAMPDCRYLTSDMPVTRTLRDMDDEDMPDAPKERFEGNGQQYEEIFGDAGADAGDW